MLVTISTDSVPAINLSLCLVQDPSDFYTLNVDNGRVTLFFEEATADRCTAVLALETDPRALEMSKELLASSQDLQGDLTFAAGSIVSDAVQQSLGRLLLERGARQSGPASVPMSYHVVIMALPMLADTALAERLFSPLGYQVTWIPILNVSDRASSGSTMELRIEGQVELSRLLNHLFVLLPMLNDHSQVMITRHKGADLVKAGEGWLETHPEAAVVVRRYMGAAI